VYVPLRKQLQSPQLRVYWENVNSRVFGPRQISSLTSSCQGAQYDKTDKAPAARQDIYAPGEEELDQAGDNALCSASVISTTI